jgi:hypothetical protein
VCSWPQGYNTLMPVQSPTSLALTGDAAEAWLSFGVELAFIAAMRVLLLVELITATDVLASTLPVLRLLDPGGGIIVLFD